MMSRLTYDGIVKIHHRHQQWLIRGQSGVRAVFKNVLIYGLDLSNFAFDRAQFFNCRIQNCRMPKSLIQAEFHSVELIGLDCSDCGLTESHFQHCAIFSVDFKCATLTDVKFDSVRFQNCNFNQVSLRQCPLKVFHSGSWVAYIGPEYTSIGCQWYPNEAWRNFTDDEIDAMASYALDYWQTNKDIIFMLMDSF